MLYSPSDVDARNLSESFQQYVAVDSQTKMKTHAENLAGAAFGTGRASVNSKIVPYLVHYRTNKIYLSNRVKNDLCERNESDEVEKPKNHPTCTVCFVLFGKTVG